MEIIIIIIIIIIITIIIIIIIIMIIIFDTHNSMKGNFYNKKLWSPLWRLPYYFVLGGGNL